jgi:hypothetical protein
VKAAGRDSLYGVGEGSHGQLQLLGRRENLQTSLLVFIQEVDMRLSDIEI